MEPPVFLVPNLSYQHAMAISVSLEKLCCHASAAVFSFCIGDNQMLELGLLDCGKPITQPTRIHALRFLRNLCVQQPSVSRRLSDMLDLEYLDTIMKVRELGPDGINELVLLWLENPQGAALPGLTWALCSDPRPSAQRAGVCLAREATWVGCQRLIAETESQPQS